VFYDRFNLILLDFRPPINASQGIQGNDSVRRVSTISRDAYNWGFDSPGQAQFAACPSSGTRDVRRSQLRWSGRSAGFKRLFYQPEFRTVLL